MSSALFPSGDWVGFYTYHGGPRRYLMDVRFTFAHGRISAAGADGIGEFSITGSYDEATRECGWTKRYLGAHAVPYRGFREGKGIWGTWDLGGAAGGFHLWPIGLGGDVERRTEAEPLAEEETFVTVPGSGSFSG